MFYPSLNKHTGEAQWVESPIGYLKLQYLKMSYYAHIWIPSWQKRKELQNQKRS